MSRSAAPHGSALRRLTGPWRRPRADPEVLLRALALRDPRAAGHAAAVGLVAGAVATAAGHSRRNAALAQAAGRLHDIGRLALPDTVLELTAAPGDTDWRTVRRHPALGAGLVAAVVGEGELAAIVHAHHERPDGRGYPRGLTGEAIPPLARVVAVAEVWDTLTGRDSYRGPMSSREALGEVRRVAGTQLDPRYVDALEEVVADLIAAEPEDPPRAQRPQLRVAS